MTLATSMIYGAVAGGAASLAILAIPNDSIRKADWLHNESDRDALLRFVVTGVGIGALIPLAASVSVVALEVLTAVAAVSVLASMIVFGGTAIVLVDAAQKVLTAAVAHPYVSLSLIGLIAAYGIGVKLGVFPPNPLKSNSTDQQVSCCA